MAVIELEDEFGDIIGKARMGLGWSLAQAAEAGGVSEAQLRAFENYERNPNEEEARAVGNGLKLNGGRLWKIASGEWTPNEEPEDIDDQAQVVRLMNHVGGYPVFSFLLVCKETNECAIVDTAAHPQQIIEVVSERKLRPALILLTHGHADHVVGVETLQKRYQVPVVMGEDLETPPGLDETVQLGEGGTCEVGKLQIRALKTPGHSDACITFVCGSVALIGDVIFSGSIGKPGHSYEASRASAAKVLALPPDTRLYPGHGPSTTVAEEKAHNPFFG